MFLRIKLRTFSFFVFFFGIALLSFDSGEIFAQDWQEEKGKHFIILYSSYNDAAWARKVLREAERYYDKIADQVGYSRYRNFWTWDDRVEIKVYSDQQSFVKATGQPSWAKGGAIFRDPRLFKMRSIVTFKQEEDFLDGVLPHEISHLILRDFIGFNKKIPIWFDEGVAQLHEKKKKIIANRLMKELIKQEKYIPLNQLINLDIRTEKNPGKASLFYAQSVSVVDFLIKKYGNRKFQQLCQFLRDGRAFKGALQGSYHSIFNSIEDLEKKWIRYMSSQVGVY